MTVFDDLDDYLSLPRVSGLAVSPDGSRVVTTVSTLNDKRTEFVSAIWELDPAGTEPARRLTHGVKGESAPVFTAGGDLLFIAVRPGEGEDKPPAALWQLPAAGGEAFEVLSMPGGVTGAVSARAAEATLVAAPLLPSSDGVDDDKVRREARKDTKVSAILHTGYPVRHWDHDLGPDQPHIFDADGRRDLTPIRVRRCVRPHSTSAPTARSWSPHGGSKDRARRCDWLWCASTEPAASAPRS